MKHAIIIKNKRAKAVIENTSGGEETEFKSSGMP